MKALVLVEVEFAPNLQGSEAFARGVLRAVRSFKQEGCDGARMIRYERVDALSLAEAEALADEREVEWDRPKQGERRITPGETS